MSRLLALVLLAGGCKVIQDAQYDDRANELEAFRETFLPATDQVQFIVATGKKLYWVSLEKPLDAPLLHSIEPATGTQIDYEFSRGKTNIQNDFKMSDDLIVSCSFGTSVAFDATSGAQLDMTDQGNDSCAVDAKNVFFDVNRKIMKWVPGQGAPVQVVDLDAQMVGTDSIDGMAVLGTTLLLGEGGRLWLIDTAHGTAKWLQNQPITSGSIVFDTRGVVYPTNPTADAAGASYTLFADDSSFLLEDKIDDGGYDLNSAHDDIQKIANVDEYALIQDHVVYRSTSGIFAYGFDTTKVVDLLLDRGTGFDATVAYRSPEVTSDGTLFVQNVTELMSTGGEVYRVDLNGRLR
jgi:hypothetical protein